MAKIPFNVKFKPQIESGEYKVVYVENSSMEQYPVEILKWDSNSDAGCIVCCIRRKGKDRISAFDENGEHKVSGEGNRLFIVTPEEKLTEFEKAFDNLAELYHSDKNPDDVACCKEYAAKLLSIAREQFIKDGYVIEKKAYHDAVENISDKHLAEMSVQYSIHCKVEDGTRHAVMNWEAFQKVAQKFIDIGKADALKDLPRWKKASGKERFSERMIVLAGDNDLFCTNYAEEGEYYLPFPILEKLPKEEDHE